MVTVRVRGWADDSMRFGGRDEGHEGKRVKVPVRDSGVGVCVGATQSHVLYGGSDEGWGMGSGFVWRTTDVRRGPWT